MLRGKYRSGNGNVPGGSIGRRHHYRVQKHMDLVQLSLIVLNHAAYYNEPAGSSKERENNFFLKAFCIANIY